MSTSFMIAEDLQRTIELHYSKKRIDSYIRQEIESSKSLIAKTNQGEELLTQWLQGEYYASKNKRLQVIKQMDLKELVITIFTDIAYCEIPELFVSVTARLAARLGFDERRDAITTVAEMVAVLCQTDAFDIVQDHNNRMWIQSLIPIPNAIKDAWERSQYLPPMLSKPRKLKHNGQSAYLTYNDSLILGKGAHHSGNICLDVLNTQNAVELSLNREFLESVEELPTFEIDDQRKYQLWSSFHRVSQETYKLIYEAGNRFYLTNKVDTRGRMYAQGYHITTQGTAFKKAMIELADKQLVQGVPA